MCGAGFYRDLHSGSKPVLNQWFLGFGVSRIDNIENTVSDKVWPHFCFNTYGHKKELQLILLQQGREERGKKSQNKRQSFSYINLA